MKTRKTLSREIICAAVFLGLCCGFLRAETIYIDSDRGNDTNPGTKEKPIQTIVRSAEIVNDSNEPGPTTIKIAPGAYCVTNTVVFENSRLYTQNKRFIIEATALSDDNDWTPAMMPVIISTVEGQGTNTEKHAIALKIEVNHAIFRGMKFLGNPRPRTWGYSIFRSGKNLEDLVVSQCMFVGDEQALPYNCPICANGQSLVVDHCVFYKCDIPAIFWDAESGISKGNAMRYCIVDGSDIATVWTCQTAEDFEFHHNIITRSQYFWMRSPNNRKKYTISDCIVTNSKYKSGYGTASKIDGQTGSEISFEEKNVIKEGNVTLAKAIVTADALSVVRPRGYLHIVPGTLGSELGAGLFKKAANTQE